MRSSALAQRKLTRAKCSSSSQEREETFLAFLPAQRWATNIRPQDATPNCEVNLIGVTHMDSAPASDLLRIERNGDASRSAAHSLNLRETRKATPVHSGRWLIECV